MKVLFSVLERTLLIYKPMRFQKVYSSGVIVLLMLGICISVVCFLLACVSYITIKNYIDALSADGNVESFTVERFSRIGFQLKVISGALFLVAMIGFWFRERFTTYSYLRVGNALGYMGGLIKRVGFFLTQEKLSVKIGLLFIVVLGVLVRWAHLLQPISYDEAFTYIYFVNRPLLIGLSDYLYPNNHVFHTFLSHLSCSIFGDGLAAIRLPAFIAGCLVVPVTFFLGRKLFDTPTALLAATGISLCNHLVEFSVMARGYSLITLFFLIIFFLAMEIRSGKNGVLAWFVLVSALAIYTVPVFIYALLIVMLWLYWSNSFNGTKKITVSLICIVVLSILLYMPVLLVSGTDQLIANDAVKHSSYVQVIENIIPFKAELLKGWLRALPLGITILITIGFFVHLITAKKDIRILAVSIIAVSIMGIFVQRIIPPARVWQFLLPLIYLLSSAGLVYLSTFILKKYAGYVIVIVGAIFLFIQTPKVYRLQPVHWGEIAENQELAQFFKSTLKETDQVKVDMPTDYPLEYYFRREKLDIGFIRKVKESSDRIFFVVNHASNQTLQEVAKNYPLDKLTRVKKMEFTEVYELKKGP